MKLSYQDVWQDGKRVAAGERDCEGRYELIADTLPAAARFTVLDVGAYAGYFATRIVEDFNAAATAVDDYDGLAAAASPQVKIIGRRLSPAELDALPRHDVVLALSVLHHFKDWQAALRALRACRRHLELLFGSAPLVCIHSSNRDEAGEVVHMREREFLPDVPPGWRCIHEGPSDAIGFWVFEREATP